MAEIRNCKQCGKLFQYNGISKICPKCRKKDDEDFKVVKEYIYENEGATITEVAEETGVEEERILRYLKDGRLEIVGENAAMVLKCERCGKGIRTGRFCDACAFELERELKDGLGSKKNKERMFTADMKKKSR